MVPHDTRQVGRVSVSRLWACFDSILFLEVSWVLVSMQGFLWRSVLRSCLRVLGYEEFWGLDLECRFCPGSGYAVEGARVSMIQVSANQDVLALLWASD